MKRPNCDKCGKQLTPTFKVKRNKYGEAVKGFCYPNCKSNKKKF